jgi:hypothetical protein
MEKTKVFKSYVRLILVSYTELRAIFIENAIFERLRTGGGGRRRNFTTGLVRGKKSRLPASSDTPLTALESVRAGLTAGGEDSLPPSFNI